LPAIARRRAARTRWLTRLRRRTAVIGSLNQSGVFSTALAVNDAAGSVSSAATVDGSSFYLTGSALGGTGPAVRYINASSGTVATTATISGRATRQAILSGDHLLVSNGATVARKIEDYGVLPTASVSSPGTLVSLTSSVNVHGFFVADLNPAIAGATT
jgi:hypothetical protein